jgi:hypothetical protein
LTVEPSFSSCSRQPGFGEAGVDELFDCVEGGVELGLAGGE